MDGTFEQLQKKRKKAALIASVAGGLSLGLIVAGGLLLAFKLKRFDFPVWGYPLIGLTVAIICWAALFFVLRPNDKKFAKKLDREYRLREKTQTMLAFRQRQGELIDLQRENAYEKLEAVPQKKYGLQPFLKLIVLPVLAIALFITAVAMPVPQTVDPTAEITDFEKLGLENLITEIRGSSLESELKTSVVGVLEGILADLSLSQTENAKKMKVFASVEAIDALVEEENTYGEVASQLKNGDQTVLIASAISGGVFVFDSGVILSSYERVTALEESMERLIEANLGLPLAALEEKIVGAEDVGGALQTLSKAITEALAASETEKEDALYSGTQTFANKLSSVAVSETVAQTVSVIFDSYVYELTQALCVQTYNCVIDLYIRIRLSDILSVPIEEFPENIVDERPTIDSDASDGEDGSGDSDTTDRENGGYGKGDTIYGGDSYIYEPDDEEHVKYGSVLDKYYAIVEELIRNGDYTEEEQKAIRAYYSMLYSGIEESEDTE